MIKEYIPRLFKYYRKRYGDIDKLVRTDEKHQFYSVVKGQPICSTRVIYYIENGTHNVSVDYLHFLVGKFGFILSENKSDYETVEFVASKMCELLDNGQLHSIQQLANKIKNLNYDKVFVLNVYVELFVTIIKFYCENDIVVLSDFYNKGYPVITTDINAYRLFGYIYFNYHLLIDDDYNKLIDNIEVIDKLNGVERLLLIYSSTINIKASRLIENKILNYLNGFDDITMSHYLAIKNLIDEKKKYNPQYDENCLDESICDDYKSIEIIKRKDNLILYKNTILSQLYLTEKNRKYKRLYDLIYHLFK